MGEAVRLKTEAWVAEEGLLKWVGGEVVEVRLKMVALEVGEEEEEAQ